MTTCEKETRAIKFGRFVTYIVRTKLVKWGKKRGENPNGTKPFPNWHAKKITGGSREGSLQVGSDEVLSCTADILIPHYLIPHFFRTTLSFGQNQFLFFPLFLHPDYFILSAMRFFIHIREWIYIAGTRCNMES